MAILDQNVHPQISELNEYSIIKITCPVCKVKKEVKFPKSVINEARQLTTISLPKGLLCDHHFQAFVDKNFIVRGYQKVDFEFETQKSEEPKAEVKLFNNNDEELFENLIVEGNFVEYKHNRKNTRDSFRGTCAPKFLGAADDVDCSLTRCDCLAHPSCLGHTILKEL